MTNLVPVGTFDDVPELETTTVALGGPAAPMNTQAQALVNRTLYLSNLIANLSAVARSGDYNALFNRPAFGSAALQNVGAFATATQGAKADGAAQASSLGAVAFSNSYLDLSDKPNFLTDAPSDGNIYGRQDGNWVVAATGSPLINPMTTIGDLIVGGTGGNPTRVGAGTATWIWTSNGPGVAPSWQAAPGGSGTVTSVQVAAPSIFNVTGGPVTTSGTITLALATQLANTVFAGPVSGGVAAPTMRTLVPADIPSLSSVYLPVASNAASATKLNTARAINGVNFDGTAAISVPSLQLAGINAQSGTTYTLVLSDLGKDVQCTNASAITVTIPLNASVAFPVGAMIVISQGGTGLVTITGISGVTLVTPFGAATTVNGDFRVLEKIATDTWKVC